MAAIVVLTATVTGLDEIGGRLGAGLATISEMTACVKKYAYMMQAQAVRNVSGTQVTYSAGTFVVNRVTGKLAQSITVLQPNPLGAIIRATAHYADVIEHGRPTPFDMKPYLMGKTVPIRASGMGGAHLGQTPVQGPNLWAMRTQGPVKGGVSRRVKKNSAGRTSKIEFIAFRKVTAHSKGWILPPLKPRPFMQAAREKIEPLFRAEIAAIYKKYVEGP